MQPTEMSNFVDVGDVPKGTPGVPRNGRDQPMVVPSAGGKPKALTRVTTFIDCIEDKSALTDYKIRMVLVGAAKERGILDAIAELDPENQNDKRKMAALAERLHVAGGGDKKANRGTENHSWSEVVDRGEALPASLPADMVADMAAYHMATLDIEMEAIEEFVVCEPLGVGGTLDRRGRYSGVGPPGIDHIEDSFIIDLKSGRIDYGALKIASQLAIYSRGRRYDHTKFPVDIHDAKVWDTWKKTAFDAELAAEAWSDLPPVNQEWGIVIHGPSGTGEATLHWADLTQGWAAAEFALEVRAMRRNKKVLFPFTA